LIDQTAHYSECFIIQGTLGASSLRQRSDAACATATTKHVLHEGATDSEDLGDLILGAQLVVVGSYYLLAQVY